MVNTPTPLSPLRTIESDIRKAIVKYYYESAKTCPNLNTGQTAMNYDKDVIYLQAGQITEASRVLDLLKKAAAAYQDHSFCLNQEEIDEVCGEFLYYFVNLRRIYSTRHYKCDDEQTINDLVCEIATIIRSSYAIFVEKDVANGDLFDLIRVCLLSLSPSNNSHGHVEMVFLIMHYFGVSVRQAIDSNMAKIKSKSL